MTKQKTMITPKDVAKMPLISMQVLGHQLLSRRLFGHVLQKERRFNPPQQLKN